jgi:hypothetical protein
LDGRIATVFGWTYQVRAGGARKKNRKIDEGRKGCEDYNPRSLRNFPMQAHGAEMLRLACCLGTENGIEICAPVHDAVLICAPLDRLEASVERMRQFMAEASRVVLDGFEIRTEAKLVRYPDHYSDPRGESIWRKLKDIL